VLAERPGGRREDLLAGLGLVLRRIPHGYKITIVIAKMQGLFWEVLEKDDRGERQVVLTIGKMCGFVASRLDRA
jgi:hypothetical protein